MAAIAAPRIDTTVPADIDHVIPSANAGANLTAIAGRPNHAAQLVQFVNKDAAASHTVVFTPEKSTQRTLVIPPNMILEYRMPVALIDSSSEANIQVIAYYWAKAGVQFNR